MSAMQTFNLAFGFKVVTNKPLELWNGSRYTYIINIPTYYV